MFLILITFIAAFSIEALGTYVSVIGLSTLFGANPIIMAIAISLDVGKLLVVSLLYTYWSRLSFLMKTYALVAAAVTMTITSAGAMGYLSGEFQKAIMGSQENTLRVDVLKTEQTKLEDRMKQIDLQIANLPKNYASSRIKLMKEFDGEKATLQERISQINKDLPALQIEQIGVEAKVGPILYISKAIDIPVEVAVKYVILMIIFVFDPLAVFLIIVGNFLLEIRRKRKEEMMALRARDHVPEPETVPRSLAIKSEKTSGPYVPFAAHPSEPEISPTEEILTSVDRDRPSVEVKSNDLKSAESAISPTEEILTSVDRDRSSADLKFREPDEQQPLQGLQTDASAEREKITLSSLGVVKPDPKTVVDSSLDDGEVGYKTGVYKTGMRPK